MDRLEKIKEIFLGIKKDMVLISLLMGKTDTFIDESYVESKKSMGFKLVSNLDFENRETFNRISGELDSKLDNYIVRYSEDN